MKRAPGFAVVFVTAPDLPTARTLAQAVLQARLAACVNLLPGLASHYWWQGRLDHSAEVLLLIKTAKRKLAALEKAILTQHPYDTPEIIALPMVAGTPRYLDWMAASIAAEKPARPRKRK